jgi:quaternary ammonium compound-resistance protein SugE
VIFLKYSQGFSRLVPSVATAGTIALSFFCMSQALKVLPMGTVYAVWTGIGAAGGMIWGIAVLGEPATALRIASISLILAGVVGLRLG